MKYLITSAVVGYGYIQDVILSYILQKGTPAKMISCSILFWKWSMPMKYNFLSTQEQLSQTIELFFVFYYFFIEMPHKKCTRIGKHIPVALF